MCNEQLRIMNYESRFITAKTLKCRAMNPEPYHFFNHRVPQRMHRVTQRTPNSERQTFNLTNFPLVLFDVSKSYGRWKVLKPSIVPKAHGSVKKNKAELRLALGDFHPLSG